MLAPCGREQDEPMPYEIDLRSDTVTKPDAAMRAAMGKTPRSPTTFSTTTPAMRRLEEEVADLLGVRGGAVGAVGVDGQPRSR